MRVATKGEIWERIVGCAAVVEAIAATETAFYVEGHFKFSAGGCCDTYLDIGAVLDNPARRQVIAKELLGMIVEYLKLDQFYGVIGIESWGNELAAEMVQQATAQGLSLKVITAKKSNRDFCFDESDAEMIRGQNWIIVDDVLTTGRSIILVGEKVALLGGKPRCAAVVAMRSESLQTLLELGLLTTFTLVHAPAIVHGDDCLDCVSGRAHDPIPGHG